MTKVELAKAEHEWDKTDDTRKANRKRLWDLRANEWEEGLRCNEVKRKRNEERILASITWLEQFGLFQGDGNVADIGCGVGRFAAEFAKKSRYVLGVDISPRMTELGNAYAKEMGLLNTEFYTGDFTALDVAGLGWQNQFDLVFTSITPAIRGKSGLDNMIAISRAWCFNSCFIYFRNELYDQIMTELFQRPPFREKTSHSNWFKKLFDVLWFRGYQPFIHYFKEYRDENRYVDLSFAQNIAGLLLDEEGKDENAMRILRFLEQKADQNGEVSFNSECWYGWTLWNVNERICR
ncbi:class I SAM-dependent methyltransferase [Dehalobacterium formicoaceticum]|uniref:class I SAM-dependent methyltransferase n=1 Tax=Dehalobacterium formicoaceticum TaxID=51515 RepID=UPI0031F713B4